MNVDRLWEILAETTQQASGGDPPEGTTRVDCDFFAVDVDQAAAEDLKSELVDILASWPEPDRLAAGPSYIEVGAIIGDQGAAFCLFGLGKALGLWKVITPQTFGFTGAEAGMMAGNGMVMISGFSPSKEQECPDAPMHG